MDRKKLIIPFFKALFTKPSVILKSIYHGIVIFDRKNYIKKKHNLLSGLPEIELQDLFPNFSETVDPFSHLYGTSLPIDLAVLKQFAKQFTNCEYMEIGSWRGESLANLSPVCNRCVSVSLSNEEMKEFGLSERTITMQRFFSKDLPNVKHIGSNSMKFDFSTIGKFDLIFVDGDHRYEAVKSDTENVFKLLKNENSIIVWHDYTKNYEEINWEVFAGIMAGSSPEQAKKIYHIKNTLLAIYINKKVSSKPYEFPSIPSTRFIITIKSEKL